MTKTMRGTSQRSYERITRADLRRLGVLARADLHSLFSRLPETGRRYRHRLFAIALCQGAALHYVDRSQGFRRMVLLPRQSGTPLSLSPEWHG